MRQNHSDYIQFMDRARLDKGVNTLLGILQGIACDQKMLGTEIALLDGWLRENSEFKKCHPFTELIPVLEESLIDEYLENEEYLDLLWICEKLRSTEYFNATTADMQVLHGIMAGIISDGSITVSELQALSIWINDHEHLSGCWPYDEVNSLILGVLADGKIDSREQKMLADFFGEFLPYSVIKASTFSKESESTVSGICAVCPHIIFPGSVFCFTGESPRHSREEFFVMVRERKGTPSPRVTKELNYLVIGSGGNPCWAYACYGRKVEQAIDLRRKGQKLLLVHENDFLDAVIESNAT